MAKYVRDLLEKKFNSNKVGFLQLGAFQNKDGKQGIILVNPDVIEKVFDEVEADIDTYTLERVKDKKNEVINAFDAREEELLAKHKEEKARHAKEKAEWEARFQKANDQADELRCYNAKLLAEVAELNQKIVDNEEAAGFFKGFRNFLQSPKQDREEELILHMRSEIRFLRHLVETGWKKR